MAHRTIGRRRGFSYDDDNAELAIFVDGTEYFAANATGIGFFAQAPVARTTYTITNYTADRDYDANAAANTVNSDVLATLIYDLINMGVVTGTVA